MRLSAPNSKTMAIIGPTKSGHAPSVNAPLEIAELISSPRSMRLVGPGR